MPGIICLILWIILSQEGFDVHIFLCEGAQLPVQERAFNKNIHHPNEIRFAPHWHEFHRAGRDTESAEFLVFFAFR